MIWRLAVAGVAAVLLSGCTDADWDHAMSFAGVKNSDQTAAQPAMRPAVVTASDNWCQRVAAAAVTTAAEQGFDAPTQKHRAQVAFQQCAQDGAQ